MYTGRGAECGPSPLFFPKDAKLEFHIESRAEGPRHADAADPRTVAALIGRLEEIFVEQVPAPEGQRPFVVIVADRDDDDKWALTFWSRNLFDEYFFQSAYQGGNGPWIRSVGMPRTFGATFDVKF